MKIEEGGSRATVWLFNSWALLFSSRLCKGGGWGLLWLKEETKK